MLLEYIQRQKKRKMSIGSPVVSSTQGFEYFAISLGDISINLCAVNDTTLETGGSVWHACCSFAKFIIHHKEMVQNKSVLELGAGCGLCGILAASLGASFVVLTDLEEQIPHLQSNVDLNKHLFKEGTVVCCPLAFGEDCNLIKKYFNSNSLVDILIGTDIGFDISLHSPLSFTIKSFFNPSVSTPDSIAYVVEECKKDDSFRLYFTLTSSCSALVGHLPLVLRKR